MKKNKVFQPELSDFFERDLQALQVSGAWRSHLSLNFLLYYFLEKSE